MFRTVLQKQKSDVKITHHDKILLIGSCFTENIGEKLKHLKFQTLNNPFGIIYNPVSIFNCLNIIAKQNLYRDSGLVYSNERYNSFEHHSIYSKNSKAECLNNINTNIKSSLSFLKKANYCFISLGTAYIYKHIESNKIVANCHKIKNNQFQKELLSVKEIVDSFENTLQNLKNINPSIRFIFTVSPIRHLKDGFHENQLSKSTLFLAINELQQKLNQVYYFPSYELLLDDLRDYRFYKDDMLHPTKKAINYIWDYFSDTFFDIQTIQLTKKIERILISKEHIPLNPKSDAHKRFEQKLESSIIDIQKQHSFLSF